MGKQKYRLDTDSLQIIKNKTTLKERLLKALYIIASGLVFTTAVIIFAYNFFESPKEKILNREIAQYKLQYKILNNKIDQLSHVADNLQERDDDIYRIIFEAEPIAQSVRKAGFGGIDRYAKFEGYKNSDLIKSTTKKLDILSSRLYVQSKSYDDVFEMAKNKEKMLASIPAIQPVSNKELKRISSYYGYRTDPFYKVRKFHHGVDFSAPSGTPIYATGDGVVKRVKRSHRGYGNKIIIDNGFNYITIFAHLKSFNVKRNEKVKRGQIIGYVGNTGKSTAPHLHYEIKKNNHSVNPIYYFFNDLSAEQFAEMVEQSKLPSQTMD
ncbi:MAG: M23 family metallopeptidase [Bacteroidota bacterium]|nr:M23 family metallopeptidase [Bacteroidota bacterium]